ncbi:C13 family peptidase [Bradyrhizobium sp. STM 3557]|uniref:C13 family peptidase n=1 Tax=Bradyrhizobium sp. STM 3557 TaxID=578920 RepID=UPI00388FA9F3
MKNLWLTLRAALKAAAWKRAPTSPSASIRTVLVWIVVAMAAEAARQYFAIEDMAAFSPYGVNTIIAETAILAVVGLWFVPVNRTAALATLFAVIALAEAVTIATTRVPALVMAAAFVAVGMSYFSRNRTAVIWKLFALGGLIELAAMAAPHLSDAEMPGRWVLLITTVLPLVVLLVWWIGALAAMFRGCLHAYPRPLLRAIGLTTAALLTIAVSPAFPTFVGPDSELSSYNLWEWTRAQLAPANREPIRRVESDSVELSQPLLLEEEVGKLRPERKGTSDIYAIGIAGWSDQDVFIKELDGGLAALDKAIGLDRGTVRLVNHVDTVDNLPIANQTNFASAVHEVAKVMNRDEDVLLLFITSHGSPSGVALRLSGAVYTHLSPDHIATVLDREGIKNRLIIVSACYSGVFVKRLASPDSVILTAADENSPSFGCSNEREWTYFGDALFNQNLASGVSLEEAFERAKAKIAEWEARDDVSPSNPQAFFGASLAQKLHTKLETGRAQHALADE